VTIHLNILFCLFQSFLKFVFLQDLFKNLLVARNWILADHNSCIIFYRFNLLEPNMCLDVSESVTLSRVCIKNFFN
jgi:hypothetical protein